MHRLDVELLLEPTQNLVAACALVPLGPSPLPKSGPPSRSDGRPRCQQTWLGTHLWRARAASCSARMRTAGAVPGGGRPPTRPRSSTICARWTSSSQGPSSSSPPSDHPSDRPLGSLRSPRVITRRRDRLVLSWTSPVRIRSAAPNFRRRATGHGPVALCHFMLSHPTTATFAPVRDAGISTMLPVPRSRRRRIS